MRRHAVLGVGDGGASVGSRRGPGRNRTAGLGPSRTNQRARLVQKIQTGCGAGIPGVEGGSVGTTIEDEPILPGGFHDGRRAVWFRVIKTAVQRATLPAGTSLGSLDHVPNRQKTHHLRDVEYGLADHYRMAI